jgi:hypothetical protein
MADQVLYTGPPGTVFTNRTARVQWQFIADLEHVCGECLSYHTWIRPEPWPIPVHRACRCQSVPIAPGADAPVRFLDRRRLIQGWPLHRQAVAVGRPNLCLLRAGLASWDDVVAQDRVRDLWEVVRRRRLTVREIRAAGVPPFRAEQAAARAQNAETKDLSEEAAGELHRREVLRRLKLREQEASKLASSLTAIGGKVHSTPPITPPSYIEELKRLLAEWKPRRRRQRGAAP